MEHTVYSGRVILFFQHGNLVTGYCTQQTGAKLQVQCADGHVMRLPAQRIVYSHKLRGVDGSSAETIRQALRTVEEHQGRIAAAVDHVKKASKDTTHSVDHGKTED